MATLGTSFYTLADWVKTRDPNGKTADIVNLLSQTNEIVTDLMFKEGNLVTGERVTSQTSLPTVYARLFNQGTPESKGTTAQYDEQCAMFTARSSVDVGIANLEADVAAFRMSKAMTYVEAMNQRMADTVFYGNGGLNPEEFTGLSLRYNSLTGVTGQNILNGGGSGSDNCSIWMVVSGPNAVYGIFPKGSMVGLQHEDLGIGDAFDASNNRFRAYMELWEWKMGLVVKDWRYAVRICNIDVSALVADASAADLVKFMARALDRPPSLGMGRTAFYMNRTCASLLRVQALNKSASAVTVTPAINQFGQNIYQLQFLGVPVRICDRLVETETAVA